jgi:hypothetical protein
MSALRSGDLSSQRKILHRDAKLENLRLQQELVATMQRRHQFWSQDTDNPEMATVHAEIANLFQEMKAQYNHLFDVYEIQSNGSTAK